MRNFDFAPFQGLKPTPSGRIPEAAISALICGFACSRLLQAGRAIP